MENWLRSILLILFGSVPGLLMAAEDVPVEYSEVVEETPMLEPVIERREFKESEIDTENFELGIFYGVLSVEDFGVSPVYGASLAWHVTEDLFLEGSYGLSSTERTSFEVLSGSTPLISDSDRDLSYYNFSLGFNLLPGEAFVGKGVAYNNAVYLLAGTGSTEFAGDDRFTLSVGLGYRLLLSDWYTLHMDVKDHVFDIDVLGRSKTSHNLAWQFGLTTFF